MSERNQPPRQRQVLREGRGGREPAPAFGGRRVVAIESATRVLGVACLEGGRECAESRVDVAGRHAERLLPELDRMMALLGWAPDTLDGIAVSIGPGSFTGLRVGLATVKGLAFGGEPPVAPVSTLAGLAHEGAREAGRIGAPVVALLDARRGEVYAAGWSVVDARAPDLLPESVYRAEELIERLPAGVLVVAGEDASGIADAVAARRPDVARTGSTEVRANAAAIARLGLPALEAGRGIPAADLVPRYVRRAEAEVQRTGKSLE